MICQGEAVVDHSAHKELQRHLQSEAVVDACMCAIIDILDDDLESWRCTQWMSCFGWSLQRQIYIYSKIGIDSIHSSLKDCSYHGVYPSNPTCHLAPGLKCGIFGLRHTDNCHGIGELSFWGTVEYQLLMCTTILVHPCHEIHMICL